MEPVRCFDANKKLIARPMLGGMYGENGWLAVIAPWADTHFVQVEVGHPYFENPETEALPTPPPTSAATDAALEAAFKAGWNDCRKAIRLPEAM
jgi:hypothetical protein